MDNTQNMDKESLRQQLEEDFERDRLRLVGSRKRVAVNYTDYISNSPEIMETLIKCIKRGGAYLMTADCAAGKTYAALVNIQQSVQGRKQVIVAVPNCIQAIQGKEYGYTGQDGSFRRTVSVNGQNKKNFVFDRAHSIIATYDACSKLLRASDENLADTVLFIDEAHQLYSARSYRTSALAGLSMAAEKITDAGGCVICMTGTPRKLDGFPIKTVIECVRTDFAGRPAPVVCFGELDLIRVACEKNTLREGVVKTILDLHHAGYIPFVRYNNKKKIREVLATLTAMGLKVYTLSADDKSYTLLKDEYGNHTGIMYDNEMFRDIAGKGALPRADVYLVTSVLEVGTSITSVLDENQNKRMPETLVPVFVADFDSFDVDDMRQFFARIRFHVKKAVILTRKYRATDEAKKRKIDNAQKPELRSSLLSAYVIAKNHAEAFRHADKSRRRFTDMNGEEEDMDVLICVTQKQQNYKIDMGYIYGSAYENYDRLYYYRTDYTAGYLEKVFDRKVNLIDLPQFDVKATSINRPVSSKLNSLVTDACKNPEFIQALSSPADAPDDVNSKIREIRQLEGGSQILQNLAILSAGNAVRKEHLAYVAVKMAESKDGRIDLSIEQDGSLLVDPVEKTYQDIFTNVLATWTAKKQARFLTLWDSLRYKHTPHCDNRTQHFHGTVPRSLWDVVHTPEEFRAVNLVLNTGYMKAIMDMHCTDITVNSYSMTWKSICLLAGRVSEKEMINAARQQQIIYFNRCLVSFLTRGQGAEQIAPTQLRSGAEYAIFASAVSAEGFTYPSQKDGRMRKHFTTTFVGKTVTPYDIKQIAALMPSLMRERYPVDLRSKRYSEKAVYDMLTNIYVYDQLDNGSIKIRNYRTRMADKYRIAPKTIEDISAFCDQMFSAKDDQITDAMKDVAINQLDTDLKRLQFAFRISDAKKNAIVNQVRTQVSFSCFRPGTVRSMFLFAADGYGPEWLTEKFSDENPPVYPEKQAPAS